jgi:hypothetical protein
LEAYGESSKAAKAILKKLEDGKKEKKNTMFAVSKEVFINWVHPA